MTKLQDVADAAVSINSHYFNLSNAVISDTTLSDVVHIHSELLKITSEYRSVHADTLAWESTVLFNQHSQLLDQLIHSLDTLLQSSLNDSQLLNISPLAELVSNLSKQSRLVPFQKSILPQFKKALQDLVWMVEAWTSDSQDRFNDAQQLQLVGSYARQVKVMDKLKQTLSDLQAYRSLIAPHLNSLDSLGDSQPYSHKM
ncbi:hypothetical protein BDV3_006128 [Batrachochytrium dendrobatidis]